MDDLADICIRITCAEISEDRKKWPPSLGFFKSVAATLCYMRHNDCQAKIGEEFGVSQPTISRAVSVITPLFAEEKVVKQVHGLPARPAVLYTLIVHIANVEVDRKASIRAAYLLVKTKPNSGLHENLFTVPRDEIAYTHPVNALQFPIRLEPQDSMGGEMIFELTEFLDELAEPFDARVEIHDAISGKMACFSAVMGIHTRRRGLRPTTYAERVEGQKEPQPWYGVMGPPDPCLTLPH